MRGARRTRSRRSQALLPLHARTRPFHNFSCWYCDFKISAFNGFLFLLGNRHARFLRAWFAVGVGFSFVALTVVTMILLQESAWAIRRCSGNLGLHNLSLGWLFGVSSWVPGFSISLMDAGIMVFSTLVSVLVHEFGHAIAAASQGIHIEYFAVFLAVIFPGALVAFNYDLLQTLPHFTALRIYCAGIWHNTVFCTVCGLTLIVLPTLLYPCYIHGERPMVLNVPPSSPLSGYLSRGDIIMSLDGSNIHNPEEWMEKLTHLDTEMLNQSYYSGPPNKISRSVSGGKGYCVPSVWVEAARGFQSMHDETSCPDDLAAFVTMPCFTSNLRDEDGCDDRCRNTTRRAHCFAPKDVVKFRKCGGWQMSQTNQSSQCLQDECCLTPVQSRGKIWVEVSFSRPQSAECLKYIRNATTVDMKSFGSESAACLETFVFIGDVSVANSIKLSAYRPRWASGNFGAYLPNVMEKVLVSMFRVSASLALLNSMPVFLLDGESILEIGLCYITWLDPRIRHRVLRLLLSAGTLLFCITLIWTFYFIFVGYH